MADLGELKLKVSGDTKDLDKSLKITKKHVAAFAAAAATAAVVLVTKLVKAQLQAIDAAAKLADRLGITMEVMGGLEHIANLTGTSVDTVGKAMQRLDVEITRANEGIGYAGAALERLGLTTQDLAGLESEEAFYRVAESLQAVTSRTMQSRIAMDLWGRQGLELLGVVRSSGSSLREMSEEARSLGLTMSRTAAAQVERFNDQLTRISAVGTGLARQLTVALAPALNDLADSIVYVMREGGALRDFFSGLITVVSGLVSTTAGLIRNLGTLAELREYLVGPQLDEPGATGGGGGRSRRPRPQPGGSGGGAEDRVEALRQALATETELETQRYEDQLVANLDFYEQRLISQQEFYDNMERIEDGHQDRMNSIRQKGMNAAQRFSAMSWHAQTSTALGELASLMAGVQATNKKLFYIQKLGAISMALVNTYQGVSKSLASYPWPLAGVMAAAHLIAGLAMVMRIKGTSYGGGGGGGSIPPPSTAGAPTAGTGGGGSQLQDVRITLDMEDEGLYSGAQVRNIMSRIGNELANGEAFGSFEVVRA